FSVALFLQELFRNRWLTAFISKNELGMAGRNRLLETLAIGALLPAVAAFVLLAWKEELALEWLTKTSRRLALTLVLWAFPPLLRWDSWDGRDLPFLLAAGVIAIATERAARTTLRAFDLAAFPGWPALSKRAPHIVVGVA